MLSSVGKTAEARVAFEKALSFDPAYAPSLAALATLAATAGDTDTAVALFDRAAGADPADIDNHYQAAQILLAAGRIEEARERLSALLERVPTHAAAANDLAWLLTEQGEDLDRARELAQRASRIEPSANTFRHPWLGSAAARRGSGGRGLIQKGARRNSGCGVYPLPSGASSGGERR